MSKWLDRSHGYGMKRVYMILNDNVAVMLGCHRYQTIVLDESNPRPFAYMQMLGFADRAIECDSDGTSRYIKHRHEPHHTAVVDTDELTWIKLSSVDVN